MEHSKDQLLVESEAQAGMGGRACGFGTHPDVPPLPAGTLLLSRLMEVEQRLHKAREVQSTPGNCG